MTVIQSGDGLFAYLPAALVKKLGIKAGDMLLGSVQGGRLMADLKTVNAEALIGALTEDNQHEEGDE